MKFKNQFKRLIAFALCATISMQSFFSTEMQVQAGECNSILTSEDANTELYDIPNAEPTTLTTGTIEIPWDAGSWGSIVADLLAAFGGSAAKTLTSATTAVEFGSYLEKRRVEVLDEYSVLSEEERLAKVFPYLYKDKTGSTKTLEVTGRDYVESHEMMNKIKSTVADTFELPISFIRSFQSFL